VKEKYPVRGKCGKRLTEETVIAILADLDDGMTQDAIGAKYGFSRMTVSNIARGKHYPHLTDGDAVSANATKEELDAMVARRLSARLPRWWNAERRREDGGRRPERSEPFAVRNMVRSRLKVSMMGGVI